uniref:WD repeat-containing protein 54 beta-propeller domain-containing protein n=1 Tax=Clastoptera arizonana TaxID=38151 RepID=A0A1B6EGE5_9HEMI
MLWKLNGEELLKCQELPNYGSACTNVKFWQDYLIAGYGSGHIRLFYVNKNNEVVINLLAEVVAHARWITALDIASQNGYILTVSEDSFIRIWAIEKHEKTTMVQKYFTSLQDCFLTGGKFLNASGAEFCVSVYDNAMVQCFNLIK